LFVWQVDEASVAGAEAAEAWLTSLLGHMGIESRVFTRIVADKKAEVVLDSPHARYLVGRRGATVKAIRELVQEAMSGTFPDWAFRVEVMGGDRGEGGRERNDGRRDRDRDRDRGGRDGDRRGRRNSERDQDALKSLAGRLAEQVLDTGEAIKIRRELNPFERRVVHLAIVEIDGVTTETQDSDDGKKVWILRDEGGESTGDTGTEE
jgi:predicted RNA-binding protein Jag